MSEVKWGDWAELRDAASVERMDNIQGDICYFVKKLLIGNSQALVRSRLLRENEKFMPKQQAFLMRRHFFFNNEDMGYFKKTQKRAAPTTNPVTDPKARTDMLKGNVTIKSKVPFPLTLRFKPILQRGVELVALDASWVSSASWYFLLNVFGLRSI
uniref:ER membrane protein complex subunit 3 n=1 Tax=Daphnia galeata TaxID=27404 RepID=A0A8J2RMX6_9CRUS|nr:unnamed protein product [Daphnia galeata]